MYYMRLFKETTLKIYWRLPMNMANNFFGYKVNYFISNIYYACIINMLKSFNNINAFIVIFATRLKKY
jgi:hypothetical protein